MKTPRRIFLAPLGSYGNFRHASGMDQHPVLFFDHHNQMRSSGALDLHDYRL